jgi:glutamate/tyrosine decarboxylase-like PLP-dependent enzyme
MNAGKEAIFGRRNIALHAGVAEPPRYNAMMNKPARFPADSPAVAPDRSRKNAVRFCSPAPSSRPSLDPANWTELRAQGHRMLDDMFDAMESIGERPLWQPIPAAARQSMRQPLPNGPTALASVHDDFLHQILPHGSGNAHPGFMGWVQGGGTPVGMLAEMLAAGLNANLGGRDHMPIEVERQIAAWMAELFGFPATSSGLFVTGTSIANFMAVLIARTRALGQVSRARGVAATGASLVGYTSRAAHGCVAQAFDMAGLGSDALRAIAVDDHHRIDVVALRAAIAADRAAGLAPFMIVGTAGSVDIGATDDLAALADVARDERLWLHIDGAFGALAILAPDLASRLAGIDRADSLAFDFHKWGQVPYDAGFLLCRDAITHRAAFIGDAPYLQRAEHGLAGGEFWPCDYGPDLSRGFRALKTWFTLRTYGLDALGAAISHSCALARRLEQRIAASDALILLAPVQLNIVCFGYAGDDADARNATAVARLQCAGRVAPSLTRIDGRIAIRAAFVNHRTSEADIDALLDGLLDLA